MLEDVSWRSVRREEGRNENVGIENDSHESAASSGVLSLDGERRGLILGKVVTGPQASDEVEAEVAPEGFLNDLAVAPSGARRLDLDGSKYVFVDCQRCPRLRHSRIIAS